MVWFQIGNAYAALFFFILIFHFFIVSTPRTVAFHTLGCKLNYSETSSIQNLFEKRGFGVTDFENAADVYVINTCSVTNFADQKCRQLVRRVLRQSPNGLIIVVGCYAQLKPDEIANIEGVDLVLGAKEKFQIVDYVETLSKSSGKGWVQAGDIKNANVFHSAFSFGDRTRTFLKIQDGCDYKCSFCTIPLARGASRSDTVENIVANAYKIAELGVKEIVLTGVNSGDYGNGTEVIEGTKAKKEALFIDLIQALDKVEAIPRFRVSSIEPNLLTDEIIAFIAQSARFVPHFHIPLQSGNDKQLAQMRRRYKRDLYAQKVETIKKYMPHACIGADVIVGFPNETDEDFNESYNFIKSLDVSYLHPFTYSERPNTLAIEVSGSVPMNKRRIRNERLQFLSSEKKIFFYTAHAGETRAVLLEKSKDENLLTGFTDNYIKVFIPSENEIVNSIVNVRLEKTNAASEMIGSVVASSR